MRVLVIGGTRFVGRHFVEAALGRGFEVDLFHRRPSDLFPDCRHILGDRDGGIGAIDGGYDWIVDTSGYLPRVVGQSVDRFAGTGARYLFVSTVSVYQEGIPFGADENAALIELDDPTTEEIVANYGGLKVLCEREVQAKFPDSIIVRPGLVAGPYDPTNRFTYWVDRFARGGEVLVPNRPRQPLQLIDGRDLGAFMALAIEGGLSGVFNTAGPDGTFGEMIETCQPLRFDAKIVWADPEFLTQHGVALWQELTLALPDDDPSLAVDSSKARAAGMTHRSLEETARDTLEWRLSVPDTAWSHGLDPSKESAVLEALRAV